MSHECAATSRTSLTGTSYRAATSWYAAAAGLSARTVSADTTASKPSRRTGILSTIVVASCPVTSTPLRSATIANAAFWAELKSR